MSLYSFTYILICRLRDSIFNIYKMDPSKINILIFSSMDFLNTFV